MPNPLFFLTIPGLRRSDLKSMTCLSSRFGKAERTELLHSFPSVTWPAQANMLTGKLPNDHGVVANGFYWRERCEVEMWTAWNEVIEQPQIWDVLKKRNPELQTAAWFPMLSKGCGADYVCMPAPIHQPDGSEDMWCYTKPQPYYGELLEQFGQFPLHHFWGPMANIKSSQWIADSAAAAAKKFNPDFFYIYFPHLDYQAQKFGPNSPQATESVRELDRLLESFIQQIEANALTPIDWMIASEYVISEVDHVTYPNRILREAGLLKTNLVDGRESIDFQNTTAWCLVDHQFSHIFVRNRDATTIAEATQLFENVEGIQTAVAGTDRGGFNLDHPRSGDVVLVSEPNSWQAYYWWLDDALAPEFATTVDIHRKPGYDPVEMLMDMKTRTVPLDATLIKGSHGIPLEPGILLTSGPPVESPSIRDTGIFDLILRRFAE